METISDTRVNGIEINIKTMHISDESINSSDVNHRNSNIWIKNLSTRTSTRHKITKNLTEDIKIEICHTLSQLEERHLADAIFYGFANSESSHTRRERWRNYVLQKKKMKKQLGKKKRSIFFFIVLFCHVSKSIKK